MACATFHLPPPMRKFALPPGTLRDRPLGPSRGLTRPCCSARDLPQSV